MQNFKEAVNSKITGLQLDNNFEFKHLETVIQNVDQAIQNNVNNVKYLQILPYEVVKQFLTGVEFINSWGRRCKISNVGKRSNETFVWCTWKDKKWSMSLDVLLKDCKLLVEKKFKNKYLTNMTTKDLNKRLQILHSKREKYNTQYQNIIKNSDQVISKELNKHTPEIKVEREAMRRCMKQLRSDKLVLKNAWNSTLTKEEQQTLINWLAKNIYSMRLYVVEGSSWDKAISELYPEEIYGKPRRTVPSEKSKDSINGYISINNIDGNVPYDILKKITHKQNSADVIKYYGKNTYRINNYLLVLYLLNNYNKNGFKLGKTNLYKDITL